MVLDSTLKVRYSRNIAVKEIGIEGQEKLLSAAVCVVGCGALGSIAASYLAGAGIGKITIIDFDNVDISNLQRQITFSEKDCGKQKVEKLKQRLTEINSGIDVKAYSKLVTAETISDYISGHDFVIDATDNPDSKYMIEKACFKAEIPYSIGGVLGFTGQIMSWIPGTAGYSDFFNPDVTPIGFTSCSIGGVLGPVPGVIGALQALEAIKCITGAGDLLTDRLLIFDGMSMTFSQLSFQ